MAGDSIFWFTECYKEISTATSVKPSALIFLTKLNILSLTLFNVLIIVFCSYANLCIFNHKKTAFAYFKQKIQKTW